MGSMSSTRRLLTTLAAGAAATGAVTLTGWVVSVTPASAAGQTYYAAPAAAGTGDCSSAANACTLPDAVGRTADGDTVIVTDGNYTVSPVEIDDSITVQAASGATPVLQGVFNARVFDIGTDSSPTVTISGLTIQNSVADIVVRAGAVTVQDSTIEANFEAGDNDVSVGVDAAGGTVTILDSTVDATATSDGVYCADGTSVSVTDSSITSTTGSAGIYNDEGATLTVSGSNFTVDTTTDGAADGINNYASATVTDSTFTVSADTSNAADGIDNESKQTGTVPTLSVTGSSFTLNGNADNGYAAAIDNWAGSAEVSDVGVSGTITGANSEGSAEIDGVYVRTGSATISGSTFDLANQGDGSYANAVFVGPGAGAAPTARPKVAQPAVSAQISASKFSVTADGDGASSAALFSDGGVTMVSGSTMSATGNGTGADAAGVWAESGSMTVADSTLTGAGDDTADIYADGGDISVHDSTVVGAGAGAVNDGSGTLAVEQSTITAAGTGVFTAAGDQVTLGADIVAGNQTDCDPGSDGDIVDEGYDIDADGSCGFNGPGSVSGSSTIAGSLEPLANNGGPTKTVALQSGSPAIGLVDGSFVLADGTTRACDNPDQRGVARPTESCDAGAYQSSGQNQSPPPPSSTTTRPTITVHAGTNPSVFGQGASFTATVSPPPDCSGLRWVVDGAQQGDLVPISSGTPTSGNAITFTLGPLTGLGVGSHEVQAIFPGCNQWGEADAGTVQVVGKAATTTTPTVNPSTLTATVAPVAPGAGNPTGTVTFSVDGNSVGTATVGSDGTATLDYAGTTSHGVTATYGGDAAFSGSSGSTNATTKNPTIVASVASAHPETRAGWYRSPVTVTFTCTQGSAPLAAPGCPGPVTLSHQGAAQSVTRSIVATDGGTASVTVSPINIDLTDPTVRVEGATDGHTYSYAHRHRRLSCVATDRLSGIASCSVTKTHVTHQHYRAVDYTAVARDKAGNTATMTGEYRTRRHHHHHHRK